MDEMAETMTVSSSQGHTAEWHDQRLTTPANADVELSSRNEFWIGDMNSTDADKFNEIFQDSVDDFNAKQTRPSRKMGAESTSQNDRKVIMMVLWMEPFAMEKESKKKHRFKKSFYRLEIKMTMV